MGSKYVRYTDELAAEILRRLGAGEALYSLCKDPRMPTDQTLLRWVKDRPGFGEAFAAARRPRRRRSFDQLAGGGFGRETSYTPGLALRVCDLIGYGRSMRGLAGRDGVPVLSTLYNWLNRHPEFRQMYAAACAARAHILRDEALEIVDDKTEDLGRAKLRADLRMRQAAICEPTRFGLDGPKEKPATRYEDLLKELLKRRAKRRA